jgi:hypothetical protein
MTFEVIEAHINAIVRCNCGEILVLNGNNVRHDCDACGRRFWLLAAIEDAGTEDDSEAPHEMLELVTG